jgi:hypothetical protein
MQNAARLETYEESCCGSVSANATHLQGCTVILLSLIAMNFGK